MFKLLIPAFAVIAVTSINVSAPAMAGTMRCTSLPKSTVTCVLVAQAPAPSKAKNN